MSTIKQQHPQYRTRADEWRTMRDVAGGDRPIKNAGTRYLPHTEGHIADGVKNTNQRGWRCYDGYRSRAKFPSYVETAIDTALGVMHRKPAMIKLPTAMEPMRDNATVKGESLLQLLERINREQLEVGRYGLLADIAVDPAAPTNVLPYIATYKAETIVNWDDGTRDQLTKQNLNLVILDESEDERQEDFSWERKEKFRVLTLGDVDENEGEFTAGIYQSGVFRGDEGTFTFSEANMVTPNVRGRILEKIPFVFVNSRDVVPEPDRPPLLSLANLALNTYRMDADYRQALFMQGQDTFVISGTVIQATGSESTGEDSTRVGAGALLELDQGGKAEYVGVKSNGLSEQRVAIENNDKEAVRTTGNLLDTESRDRESGDALRIRRGAQTASLTSIAKSGAAALEDLLKMIAEWIGANPDEVEVVPNLDFDSETMDGRSLKELQESKLLGAPISEETIHERMVERKLTTKTLEEEREAIANEQPLLADDTDNPQNQRGVQDDNGGGEGEDE